MYMMVSLIYKISILQNFNLSINFILEPPFPHGPTSVRCIHRHVVNLRATTSIGAYNDVRVEVPIIDIGTRFPSSPAYGVFISQLIRYARACSSYECFILRTMRLSNKLLGQGYVKERLKSSLRKFYGRYGDLTKQYEVPLSRMLHDILDDDHIQ